MQPIDINQLIHSLLSRLREEGFSVGTDIYIQTYQLLQWFLTTKPDAPVDAFGSYLGPVVCKSDEEQVKFNRIFEKNFTEPFDAYTAFLQTERIKELEIILKKERKQKKKWVILALFILTLLSGSIFMYRQYTIPPDRDYSNFIERPIYAFKDQGTSFSIASLFEDSKDTVHFGAEYIFHHSGERRKGATVHYAFDHYGRDSVTLILHSERFGIDEEIVHTNIFVGPKNKLSIKAEKEIVNAGEPNVFEGNIDPDFCSNFYWKVNGKVVGRGANKLEYTFDTIGVDTITLSYDEKDPALLYFPREILQATYLQEIGSSTLKLQVKQGGSFISESNINTPVLVTCFFILLLLIRETIKAMYWNVRSVKEKADPENFHGDQPPYNLEFTRRDQHISGNSGLNRLSNELKKRTDSQAYFFNIHKSIKESIGNLGFFSPQFSRKQIQREYLLLIDHPYANSQQTKLFTYLARFFVHRSVLLDTYYFNQTPDKFYKEIDGPRFSLSQIKDSHYNASLIIISNGLNFLEYNVAALKSKIIADFSYWPSRVLLSPVPANDWGSGEAVLSTFFKFLPADIIGLMELVQAIENEESLQETIIPRKFYTYDSKYVDYNTSESLRNYLDNDEELFQWLCAAAVHPKLYWEVFLEMGAKLVKSTSKINYETLLKLARIKWMNEGIMPPQIRLMLLKELTVENELLARAVFLRMLDEVPDNDEMFSLEEKQLSRYANSFILLASGKKEYTDNIHLQENADQFIELYKNKKLADNPFLIYIAKNPEDGMMWKTPVISNKRNTGIDEYIRTKEGLEKNELNDTSFKPFLKWGTLMTLTLLCLFFLFEIQLPFQDFPLFDQKPLFGVQTFPINCKSDVFFNSGDSTVVSMLSAGPTIVASDTFKYSEGSYLELEFDSLYETYHGQDLIFSLLTENQIYTTKLPFLKEGLTYITLTGDCPDEGLLVEYYPGLEEDTSVVTTNLRKDDYHVVTRMNSSVLNTNHVIFDWGIDTTTMFNFLTRLINSGFDIRFMTFRTAINSSALTKKKTIEIRGDSLFRDETYRLIRNEIIITKDSLECLFYKRCKENPKMPNSIQVIHNNKKYSSKSKLLKACIGRKMDIGDVVESVNNSIREDKIVFYIPTGTFPSETFSLISSCLNDIYPDKIFKYERKSGASPYEVNLEIHVIENGMPSTRPSIRPSTITVPILPAKYYITDFVVYEKTAGNFDGSEEYRAVVNFDVHIENLKRPSSSTFTGQVCLENMPASCMEFTVPSENGSHQVLSVIPIPGNVPGRYNIVASLGELKVDTLLGYVNFKRMGPSLFDCDTLYGYLSKDQKDDYFTANGRRYSNSALRDIGINIELLNFDGKELEVALTKDKCTTEKLRTWIGDPSGITFCDNTRLTINVDRTLNSSTFKNKWLKNNNSDIIIFIAILCD